MAEFLIKATTTNWMDTCDWVAKGVTQEMYDRRSEKGDIIIVKPDNTRWNFSKNLYDVKINVPELDYEKAKATYEGCLYETTTEVIDSKEVEKQIMRKKMKFCVSTEVVDEAIKNNGQLTMSPEDFEKVIMERTIDETKSIITQAVSISAVIKEI